MSNPTIQLTDDLQKELDALNAQRGFNPPSIEYCRFFILGEAKVGKTHLVSGMPYSLLIDTDGGAHSVLGGQAYRVWCPVYTSKELTSTQKAKGATSLQATMEFLEKHSKMPVPYFRHVIFDTVDRLQEMTIPFLTKTMEIGKADDIREAFGGLGGWSRVNEHVLGLIRRVFAWGYGWTAITHTKYEEKIVSKTPYLVKRATVTPGIQGGLSCDAEYILGLQRTNKFVVGGGTREVIFVETETKQASKYDIRHGGRVSLPTEIEIPHRRGFDAIAEAYQTRVEQIRKEESTLSA